MTSFAYLVETGTRLAEIVNAIEAKFALTREPNRAVQKTVLDTFDWRLHARACTLCAIRQDGSFSLSLDSPRQLLSCPLPNGELPAFDRDIPAGRIRELVGSAIEVRRLLARAQVELKVRLSVS